MFDDAIRVANTYWTQFLYVLPRLVIAAVLLAAVWVGASRLRVWLAAKIGAHANDPLLIDFLTQIGRWLLVGIGIILALNILGLSQLVSGMLAGLGLSAFVVGFAFKDIAENFLAGILLAFNRPFSINDTIQIKDMFGRVTHLNLRTTTILTFDGRDISIPNAVVLKEPLINFTQNGFIRQDFVVGIGYNDDAKKGIELMLKEIEQEADVKRGDGKDPFAVVEELALNSVNIKVFFWATTDSYRKGVLELKSRIINRILVKLTAEGFSFPSNIVELQYPPAPLQIQSAGQPATGQPASAAATSSVPQPTA
ncbi:mechanosensitive ion channel family protein [Hymenobacter sp. RP-2-7]|uniref:Mechanosensitive ion channel family protein n=1 Tax=Hymenobacter polaris TaxID=2682546 RepID=A0A7Y0AA52_9BACT|nr:mechanosensitive ion channel family protein [Hymenobacter polaris]NML63589.1 mechanosensitive ion channel family protein [Hymenobacter polaris]